MEMLFSELSSLFETETLRPLKRVEYDRLVSEGYFEDEKVELLFGVVVAMSPIDQEHIESTYQVHEILRDALGKRAKVYCQASFAATDDSEPEPDIFVVPGGQPNWAEHHSRAYLVVEVARSSLRKDRGPKALLYSLSNVDEYWIVDHVHGQVEVYRDRVDGSWRSKTVHHRGDVIAMATFPDVEVPVSQILRPID